jgi:hypothetical protein
LKLSIERFFGLERLLGLVGSGRRERENDRERKYGAVGERKVERREG